MFLSRYSSKTSPISIWFCCNTFRFVHTFSTKKKLLTHQRLCYVTKCPTSSGKIVEMARVLHIYMHARDRQPPRITYMYVAPRLGSSQR